VIFNDANASGTRQSTEGGLSGRKVYLDISGKETVGRRTATTDSKGNFSFTALPAGNYVLSMAAVSGWRVTTPSTGSSNLTLKSGGKTTGLLFGQTQTAAVSGNVFSDFNGDGIRQTGEPELADWTVSLLSTAGKLLSSTISDASGNYRFPDVAAGSYHLSIISVAGYIETSPTSGFYTLSLPAAKVVTAENFAEQPAAYLAKPLISFEVAGYDQTAGQTSANFSTSVNVKAGDTIVFEVLGAMAPVGTTVGSQTISSLIDGLDGIISFPSILADATPGNIPITFKTLTLASGSSSIGSNVGPVGGNTISFKDQIDTAWAYHGIGVTANNTPGFQLLATGTLVIGAAAKGTTVVTDGWGAGNGTVEINGGSPVVLTNATHATYDTNAYTGLTLKAS
jgi:hypothetical protein